MQRRWTPATLELRSCRDRCSGQRSIQHRTRSPHDRRDHPRGSGLAALILGDWMFFVKSYAERLSSSPLTSVFHSP